MTDRQTAPERQELRNTLYRRLTRAGRRLTPARILVYRAGASLAWGLLRLLWGSCRLQPIAGLEVARAALKQHGSVIPVYWHQHILFGVRALVLLEADGLKPGFLISPSVDGTAPAMLVRKLGGQVIRGSSTHTGARALRDFYELIVKQQVSPAITPDGPRGPMHEFKQGAVVLAQITGRPILPIAVAASRRLVLSTWDRFELPLPFSRVAISIGAPVGVPRALDAAGQAQLTRSLAETLHALKVAGLASLGRHPDEAQWDEATHDR